MPELRPTCEKPCNDCPFRRKSMPGWLGDDTPENFIATTMSDYPMPCHQTIDYSDPDWKRLWERVATGKLCGGALIFFANISKLSRWPDRPRLPADKENIFASPAEFIAHHTSLKRPKRKEP